MEGELGRAVVVETIGMDMSVELGELDGVVTVDQIVESSVELVPVGRDELGIVESVESLNVVVESVVKSRSGEDESVDHDVGKEDVPASVAEGTFFL